MFIITFRSTLLQQVLVKHLGSARLFVEINIRKKSVSFIEFLSFDKWQSRPQILREPIKFHPLCLCWLGRYLDRKEGKVNSNRNTKVS